MEKRKLMATFINKRDVKKFIEFLYKNDVTEKVFVLRNSKQNHIFILTYNIKNEIDLNMPELGIINSVSIQRNKETNTLYSINVLNALLESAKNSARTQYEDNGRVHISWKPFTNCFLSLRNNHISKIRTKLYKIINIPKNFDINKVVIK